MFSFSKIVTLTAVVFGTLTQAVPLSQRDSSINARIPDPATSTVDTPTLESVFDGLLVQLNDAVNPLHYFTDRNASAPYVQPVMVDVTAILQDAVNVVRAMAIRPADDVLKGTNEVILTLSDVVSLVSGVVDVVFNALNAVVEAVEDLTELLQILPIVITLVGQLLQAVVDITKVVFGNALVSQLETLVSGAVITQVLTVLKYGSIFLN
ncbi:hypothetical protein BJV74DRAFT_985955 [Russula compacta]|nr:hypothetical protein BJV74DRAFT_985955 [Russula compacta]